MARLAKSGNAAGTTAPSRVPTRAGGGAWRVKASQESLGGTGSCGHAIVGNGYSELSTVPMGTASDFVALGNLPCGTVLNITNPANGKTVQAAKQDVGSGSPGFLPVMGLYPTTVQQLGLSGGEYNVIISRADGGTLKPVRGTPAGAGDPTSTGSAGAVTPTKSGSGTSLLDVLRDLVTGDIGDLAAALAMAVAAGVKDAAIGFGDLVIVPVWHRNQQAVWYYTDNVLFPGKSSPYKAWITWPANAAFWGFGYGLLFTDPTTGSLKPASPRQSRIARHVRGAQGLPARQSLIKPGRVAEKTPKKPVPRTSKVPVKHVASLHTHRRGRPVSVTGQSQPGRSDDRQRVRPTRTGTERPVVSEVPIKQIGDLKVTAEEHKRDERIKAEAQHPANAKSYPNYPGRKRARSDSQLAARATARARAEAVRRQVRHRRDAGGPGRK